MRALEFALAAALVWSCTSSATIKQSWTAPGVTRIESKKVAVFMVAKSETTRRTAEEAMAAKIQRAQAVPGHLLRLEGLSSDAVVQKLQQQGFDGVIVMRIVGKKQQVTVEPGTYTGGFGPYWDGAWAGAWYPSTVRTDEYTYVETHLYWLGEEKKLLWTATSEVWNANNTEELIGEVASAMAEKLREQGLLQ